MLSRISLNSVRTLNKASKAFVPNVKRSFSTISLKESNELSSDYSTYSNDLIIQMSVFGDQNAREERLIRDIMAVDNVEW